MKTLSLVMISLFCLSNIANALSIKPIANLTPGKFIMHDGDDQNNSCEQITELTLDKAQLSGNIALLKNRIAGECDLYITPNNRHYKLKAVDNRCGSITYVGTYHDQNGKNEIKIVDHRHRLCEDMRVGQVEMVESINGMEVASLINKQNRLDHDISHPPVTCMAFWSGWSYNSETGSCQQASASGCSNPFHKTKVSCEAAAGL